MFNIFKSRQKREAVAHLVTVLLVAVVLIKIA